MEYFLNCDIITMSYPRVGRVWKDRRNVCMVDTKLGFDEKIKSLTIIEFFEDITWLFDPYIYFRVKVSIPRRVLREYTKDSTATNLVPQTNMFGLTKRWLSLREHDLCFFRLMVLLKMVHSPEKISIITCIFL